MDFSNGLKGVKGCEWSLSCRKGCEWSLKYRTNRGFSKPKKVWGDYHKRLKKYRDNRNHRIQRQLNKEVTLVKAVNEICLKHDKGAPQKIRAVNTYISKNIRKYIKQDNREFI